MRRTDHPALRAGLAMRASGDLRQNGGYLKSFVNNAW
jgi:hypothetical protein